MERSKGGERRAVREGDVLVGSALIAVHGGGHWRCLAVVIRLRRRALLLSVVAVHPWLLSVFRSRPARVVEFLSVVGNRWWWCRISWVCACPFVAGGGCEWFSQALVVV